VSPHDTIQQIKSRIFDQLNIPVNQQKLVLKGKPLHDGSLEDHQIANGCKLHLITSAHNITPTAKPPVNTAFTNELHLLAAKWTDNPNDREAFVVAFQKVIIINYK
jgi:hypothetical protein